MNIIQTLAGIIASVLSVYSIIIFVRIIFSWFQGPGALPGPAALLSGVTDPYLNAFRRFSFLRAGSIDLSPIAALAVLSLATRIFTVLAQYGRITVGIILTLLVQGLWSAVSFLILFAVIVLALRLIAYLTNRNIYAGFWRIVDTISQPLLYTLSRIFFGRRIVSYLTRIIVSIIALLILYTGLHVLVRMGTSLLRALPF